MLTVTANQLVAHAIGDYLIQTDWMASEKTKGSWPALIHAITYAIPFLFLATPSVWALLVVVSTHFAIDRWRLARYVVWVKNSALSPSKYRYPWKECQGTGYHESRPAWLAVWLLIIADNVLHVLCNAIAIQYL